MTKREKIAKAAAKKAALATYKAIMEAPVRKVATIAGPQAIAPSSKEVAKIAAKAVYGAISKLGQRGLMDYLETNYGEGAAPAAARQAPAAGYEPKHPAPPTDTSAKNPSFNYQSEKSYARIRNLGAPTLSHVVEQAAHGQGASYDVDAAAQEWAAVKDKLQPEDRAAIQKLIPSLQ